MKTHFLHILQLINRPFSTNRETNQSKARSALSAARSWKTKEILLRHNPKDEGTQ